MRFVFSLAIVGLLASPFAIQAQSSAVSRPGATITGVAVDSVRGGYLKGAIVSVSGTTLSAMTDSVGRFRIDSVPAGTRYLEVMHPLLDSLSLIVRSPEKTVPETGNLSFVLAVPSAKTIVAAKCNPADLARGSAALVGTVQDADTDAPASGATVSVEWLDYQLSSRSMSKLPQRRVATVRPDGTYRVCGIPSDLITGAVAYRGTDSTSHVPVNFANGIGVVSFHLPAAEVASAPAPAVTAPGAPRVVPAPPKGHASLIGKVVDVGGTPLAGARIELEADDAVATSDNQGNFALNGLRSGTRSLSVRRLGFQAMEIPVDLSATAPRRVTVTMSHFVPVLDAVRVSAIREIGLNRVGFTDRKKSGNGTFYGPDVIAARNPDKLNMLLETAPSLRMGTDATGHRYVTGRNNGCVQYYVDGHLWYTGGSNSPDMTPDGFLSTGELAGVEVYD